MNQPLIYFQDISKEIYHRWWILFIGMIIGGFLGLLINRLIFPPIFAPDARISILINFQKVGHLETNEQDQYIGAAISLFQSDEVILQTIDKLAKNNIDISESEFKKNATIERQLNEVIFRYTDTDLSIAVLVTNLWSQEAFNYFSEAYDHAVKYSILLEEQDLLDSCFQQTGLTQPSDFDCIETIKQNNYGNDDQIKNLLIEKEKSKGIFPGLSFTYISQAESSQEPVRNQTNIHVLSGVFFGLMVTYLIFYFVPRKK